MSKFDNIYKVEITTTKTKTYMIEADSLEKARDLAVDIDDSTEFESIKTYEPEIVVTLAYHKDTSERDEHE